MSEMTMKDDLARALQNAREALLWKLDGLDEYELRRPLVPSGTNLLGLVEHVASREAVGDADMWATTEESSASIGNSSVVTPVGG